MESGTESEWVAQALEGDGHEVIVVDPNFAPMYGELRRKVKTDTRDVAALAEANRRGWYRAAHRATAEQRARRQGLRVRRQLVQMRSGSIAVIRALLRQTGARVGTGSSAGFGARLATHGCTTRERKDASPVSSGNSQAGARPREGQRERRGGPAEAPWATSRAQLEARAVTAGTRRERRRVQRAQRTRNRSRELVPTAASR